MRRVVVVGLLGGAVVVTAVALSRRRSAPLVFGQPDWAPLALTGPAPASPAATDHRPSEPPQAHVQPLTEEQIERVASVEPVAAVGDTAAASAADTATATDTADPANGTAPEPSVAALADGGCPLSHPVKASASGIYHLPGGRFYDSLRAKRCYRDAEAAEADGLRPSKR